MINPDVPKDIPRANRILVIRYRFIGDTILTVPFLRNLRRAYPRAIIDVLVGPQSGLVLENCPYVNELITFDTTRFHKYDQGQGKAQSFWHYANMLRKNKYDAVFVLKRSLSSAFLAWYTGARFRAGYATEGRAFLLTHSVPWNKNIHEVDSTLDILGCANIPVADKHLEAWISDKEISRVREIAPQLWNGQRAVLIHAAAAHPDKMYPLESWAAVLQHLSRKEKLLPYFTGAEADFSLYERLISLAQVDGINLAGKLTLRESMALYSKMELAVCVDSGPAHLAAAAGIPTVAIFGPTDPFRWRPYGDQHVAVFDRSISCEACHKHKELTEHACLSQLDPQKVIDSASALYATRRQIINC
ncbi:MAG TPA: glycosyltransferase family 9 protein [Candidatus Obscuribacterales bacterium]